MRRKSCFYSTASRIMYITVYVTKTSRPCVCYLQHVHHLFQLSVFDASCMLHSKTLKVFNEYKAIDLSLLIFQKFLQDNTISPQSLSFMREKPCRPGYNRTLEPT